MKISELKKILKKNRCYIIRNGANHDVWYSPITDNFFLIPRHPAKEIKTGLLNKILKDAGLKK